MCIIILNSPLTQFVFVRQIEIKYEIKNYKRPANTTDFNQRVGNH